MDKIEVYFKDGSFLKGEGIENDFRIEEIKTFTLYGEKGRFYIPKQHIDYIYICNE